ncbi:family S53 protease [Dichomitus squalens LYAD-421 SS1]|uniref:tripeptidyl-peptidase II n=1 Tax=Dichomitus squalens (strain LYAD-421) TaxID=732165 RepID=R7SNY9_DICSQ|nr:family S53 protease [Dichomitus squalens LYAD-421 SS1]EJF57919.1 family S53 protease [Dichomitus squalens LYAD-421 SS1]
MVAAGLLVLSSLFSLALAAPSLQERRHVVRAVQDVPRGFSYLGKASQEQSLNLRIALVQNNATGLEKALYDVSNPASENYGHHLTKAEVEALVAPSAESVQKVKTWLSNNNITAQAISPAGDWLSINVPVSKANALLSADFNEYTHDASNKTAIRTLTYSVPETLKGHLAFVYPTTQFIEPAKKNGPIFKAVDLPRASKRSRSKRAVDASCDTQITPSCLQQLYNIPTTPASAAGNSLGVSGFGGEIPNQDDLTEFLSVLRPDATDGTFDAVSVDGGNADTSSPGTTEATLDIQYTVGVATNVPTTFISVGDQNQDGDLTGFLDIINSLLAEDNPPLVLTTSFGFNELGFVQEQDLAVNLCNAYGQLGARGTSILFASGDGGVSGPQASDACDGQAFEPTFPSGCPFLTSVGSTQGIKETAADFSSGGFSNIFAQPDYQADAVAGYLKTLGTTNQGLFNPQGRAFPDVSAQGVNFVVDIGGQGQGVSGTSASSPTFASVVALLNDELLNQGKSPLGFLNPLLYSSGAAALNDITSGSNPGCGTDGFPAVEGWDAVTGLGTPDFNKLLTLVTGSAATGGNATSTDGAASTVAATTDAATVTATSTAAPGKHHHHKNN